MAVGPVRGKYRQIGATVNIRVPLKGIHRHVDM